MDTEKKNYLVIRMYRRVGRYGILTCLNLE